MADHNPMQHRIATLMVIVIIAGIFSLTGNAAGAVEITKITFFILFALIMFAFAFDGRIWKKATN